MSFADNLASVRARMEKACARAQREPASVTLLAVTKGVQPESVHEAAQAGLTLFGENKVQEARAKLPLCPGRLHWHLIGHLQSNKCRDAVHLFEMIHSVDSVSLAEELQKQADKQAKTMPLLLEVNLAGESTKFGFKPEQIWPAVEAINACPSGNLKRAIE